MVKHIGDGNPTDFDETRRLLYMAMLVSRTKRYNLAGSLVNALKHHHAVDGLDAGEIADHVVSVVNGTGPADPSDPDVVWLNAQIQRITDELGD